MPGLQQGHRGIMVDRLGVQGADEADLVGELRGVRQQFAQPHPAPAVLLKLEDRGRDRKTFLSRGHSGEALLAAHGVRQVLVKLRGEARLVVEEIDLRRRPGLGEPDHAFRPGGEVGGRGGEESRIREGGKGEGLEPVASRKRCEGGFSAHELTLW